MPIIGKGVKFVLGNTDQDALSIYKNIQKNLSALDSAEERHKYISQYIDKINSEDLRGSNISGLDKEEIKKALKEVSDANKEELKVFKSKILSEIEKLKNNK
jgi:hypothetical protein